MHLQDTATGNRDGIVIRAISSLLLLLALALLVGSLIMAHSVNSSPNSGRMTSEQQIKIRFRSAWRPA